MRLTSREGYGYHVLLDKGEPKLANELCCLLFNRVYDLLNWMAIKRSLSVNLAQPRLPNHIQSHPPAWLQKPNTRKLREYLSQFLH